ncbi:anti-sigma factor [Actinokineospora pegani]|uniref:hypothetical protein n=1 Tax=Actinokineospora pegani TaxID=2654637 RepID=UPI0012E9C727|nr:hypothetical protein [Actinokineospora pegani]
MTDEVRGGRGPWSVDLLADLHAGVLDPAQSQRLWAQVNTDPQARAVLDALESVRTGLGDLGAAPVEPMPAQFSARLDAALEAEARRAFGGGVAVAPPQNAGQQPLPQTFAPVVSLDQARRRKGRVAAWAGGLVTAAAAAVALAFVVLPNTTDGTAVPPSAMLPGDQGPGSERPLAVGRGDLGAAIGKVGTDKDYGALRDQAGLDRCLRANDIDATTAQVVGVKPVTLDGTPGTLAILLPPGELGKLQVLVVKPDCAPIANEVIGR